MSTNFSAVYFTQVQEKVVIMSVWETRKEFTMKLATEVLKKLKIAN